MIIGCEKVVLYDEKSQTHQVKPARIHIQGSLISRVEELEDASLLEKKNQHGYLYFADKLISPAFVNAHTHLAMNCFRLANAHGLAKRNMIEDLFFRVEDQMTAQDVYAFARIGAYESLLAGVGFVWDHYYFAEEIAQAFADSGLAGVIAPTLQDIDGPGVKNLEKFWNQTLAIHKNSAFKKVGIFSAFGPHATDTVSLELLEKIGEAAHKENLPVHMHVAQSYEEVDYTIKNYGLNPYQVLLKSGLPDISPHNLWVHNVYAQNQDLESFASSNNTLCFCPFSQTIFAFPADVLAWEDAGVRWIVATDCAASNDSMNPQKELRQVAAVPAYRVTEGTPFQEYSTGRSTHFKAANDNRQMLKENYKQFSNPDWLLNKIWSLPGQMHPEVKVGQIRKGSLANLVIWDANHPCLWPSPDLQALAFSETQPAIWGMFVAGRQIGEFGSFHDSLVHSRAYQECAQEATNRLHDLFKRARVFDLSLATSR